MGKQIRVNGVLQNGNIYVKLDDVIKTLYSDHTQLDDEVTKEYIINCIDNWEEYKENILKKV